MPGLTGGEQVLAAVLHPLHRRADLGRGEHQAHLVALDHDLLPEAATGVAHHDPDAVLGHAEQARAEEAHLVRRLGRRVDRQLARRARVVDDQAASFHRHRGVRLLVDRLAHHVGGRGEHLVERGGGQAGDLADDVRAVALVHERVGVLGRGVVDDRRQAARSRPRPARPRPRRDTGSRPPPARPGRRRSAPPLRPGAGAASRGSSGRSRCATAPSRPGSGRRR